MTIRTAVLATDNYEGVAAVLPPNYQVLGYIKSGPMDLGQTFIVGEDWDDLGITFEKVVIPMLFVGYFPTPV